MAPTVATTHTVGSTSSAQNEITEITANLDKLENKKLASQRFVPSEVKSDTLSKLALGAKLERALGRRMGGQDAVMRTKKKHDIEETDGMDEKVKLAAVAA